MVRSKKVEYHIHSYNITLGSSFHLFLNWGVRPLLHFFFFLIRVGLSFGFLGKLRRV